VQIHIWVGIGAWSFSVMKTAGEGSDEFPWPITPGMMIAAHDDANVYTVSSVKVVPGRAYVRCHVPFWSEADAVLARQEWVEAGNDLA